MADEKKAAQPTRELVPVKLDNSGLLRPTNLQEAIEVAKLIAYSGMTPKDYASNPGAVLVAIEMGHELGLSPMSSIQNIAVINGRPSLWGDAMLALVVSRSDCEDVIEVLDEKTMTATCTVKRTGRSPVERSFSIADAKTAGLAGKQGPWQQYPKRMLQMRARGFALRDAFPDALRGIVSHEEAADMVVMAGEHLGVVGPGRPPEGKASFGSKAKPHEKKEEEPQDDKTEVVDPDTGEVAERKPSADKAAATNTEAGF